MSSHRARKFPSSVERTEQRGEIELIQPLLDRIAAGFLTIGDHRRDLATNEARQ